MTQIFPRKSELAFPVFGSQQTRSRDPPSRDPPPPTPLLPRNSINCAACFLATGRSHPIESIVWIASRNSEKEQQGNDAVELSTSSSFFTKKHVLSPFPAENILIFSYMNYLFQREETIWKLSKRFYIWYIKDTNYSEFFKFAFLKKGVIQKWMKKKKKKTFRKETIFEKKNHNINSKASNIILNNLSDNFFYNYSN